MDNFDKYADYTKVQDWESICKLNGLGLDSFGTKKELKVLHQYLEPDEVVFALASGMMKQTTTSSGTDVGINTWLVALTNDRFLFLDHALLTKSVDTQSIRHDKVQAVSASQGFLLGEIMVDIGSRIVRIDNCHKGAVKVMANLANKWLKELHDNQKSAAVQVQTPPPAEESSLDKLKKLKDLHSMGALTDEEFDAAKQKILASL
jgi:hypothetical protein